MARVIVRNRVKQALCRWCFEKVDLDTLAREAAGMGYVGIDLVEPAEWGVLKRHGLVCSMTPSHSLTKGLCDRANHAECLAKIRASIDATAAGGFARPNVICFPGNRAAGGVEGDEGDEIGAQNMIEALKQVVGHAEAKGVTLYMELLNSKVDHPGYMGDRSEWAARVAKAVGSPRFKLLYDIYHMQVQEGDVIATIRKHHALIGHYHTAGVPGRHELSDSQELNYPAIMRAIVETGFDGFVAQEFVPAGDAMEGLREAGRVCDV